MRKQTKLVAVLSAAALLAIGASMTSYAKGWTQEDGVWVFLDKDGERVTDKWEKSGSGYYYLNEDGEMAMDTIVEDDNDNKYYVDASGARVTNRWVSVDNEEDEPIGGSDDISTIWYYFGSNGKAYKGANVVKTIDGKKYIFDENGHMLSGWQIFTDEEDSTKKTIYYLGGENEGWASTGWMYLEPADEMEGEYDDEEWFYFSTSNGKASYNKRQYINGKYYSFDEWGVMQSKWMLASIAKVATPSRYKDKEDGSQAVGWVQTYAVTDTEEDGDLFWYYIEKNGVPFNFEAGETATANKKDGSDWSTVVDGVAAKVIKSKTYLFNDEGKMQTGVFKLNSDVTRGNDPLKSGIYYFTKGGSAEGAMATGKTSVTYDDTTYNYYFQKSGQAYTWMIKGSSLYDGNGERVDAEDGNTYEVVTLSTLGLTADDTIYNEKVTKATDLTPNDRIIVNANGKIKQSGSVKIDGVTYIVKGYKVTETKND